MEGLKTLWALKEQVLRSNHFLRSWRRRTFNFPGKLWYRDPTPNFIKILSLILEMKHLDIYVYVGEESTNTLPN
jgi:hypothetical protein